MNKGKLDGYRSRLLDERARLMRSVERNRTAAGEIRVEHTEDEADLAIISHDRELLYNLNQGDLAWLQSVRDAVERIDRNEYGKCVNCEEDIDERRLTAAPWAGLCIRCQEQMETDDSSVRNEMSSAEPESPEF